jgi:hypothetical protein
MRPSVAPGFQWVESAGVKTIRTIAACALLTVCCAVAVAAPDRPYRSAPPAAWIDVAPDASLTSPDHRPVDAGDHDFLLVDNQVRLSSVTAQYSRYAELLVNQAAAAAAAQISINIDPTRERVLLHAVRVFRNGRAIDKLADARVSLLNREQELEQGLINGRVTLHILLQDVRVDDVLDYSFTHERSDPPEERKYQQWFMTQWSTPVRRLRLRLLHTADRQVNVKDLGGLGSPRHSRNGEWQETVWDARNLAALPEEAARPRWHIRYPRVEFSEFRDWGEVRAWSERWYDVGPAADAALDALVAELEGEPDEAARIVRALRFVQDDIRYTGLEIGAGAWRPTAPTTVLARRYGDCKDKVLLFVTLLRKLGIDAHPALVHSQLGRGIAERLPSAWAFDHVIARVKSRGRSYWLDATASGQGGALDSLVQANFGLALVLAPGVGALETIPAREANVPHTRIVETYDFRKGITSTAQVTVHTSYHEQAADNMRLRMRSTTTANLGKEYLDYYRRSYRGIRMIQPPVIHDDRARNIVNVEESYAIDEPFEKKDDARQFIMEASLVTEQTGKPEVTVRTSPLARTFPMYVRHEIVAHLPHAWNVDAVSTHVADPAFDYNSTVTYGDQRLSLVHELRNLRDHVPVENLAEFLAKLDQARNDAFYTLTDYENAAPAAAGAGPRGPSFAVIMTFIVGLGIGGLVVAGLRRLPWRLPQAEPGAPSGLHGWMILPLVGVIASVAYVLFQAKTWFTEIGTAGQFEALAERVQLLLLIELLIHAALIVISIFTAYVMLRRRRTFPAAFVTLQLFGFSMLAVDTAALAAMGEALAKDYQQQTAQLAARALATGMWCFYVLVSQRVRATFVEPRGDAGRMAVPAAAPG